MIYPTTLSSALRTSPNLSSPLYRRWFPGSGQRGGGFAGMGCDPNDPTDPTCAVDPVSAVATDPNMGDPLAACAADPNCSMPIAPSLYSQLIAQGVAPVDAYQYDPTGAIAAGVDPSTLYAGPGSTITNVTPGTALTPAQSTALSQQVAAQAALLKMVPAATSAALTAAQLAAGLTAGTIAKVATTVCPSGYRSSTGACVAATGQWFSFATNAQVMTYGAVLIGALILIPALSGGRRRR
jgi:hypothetical protein